MNMGILNKTKKKMFISFFHPMGSNDNLLDTTKNITKLKKDLKI